MTRLPPARPAARLAAAHRTAQHGVPVSERAFPATLKDGARKMGTVTIKIPLVTWRDGKPRYWPSAAQRAMGYHYEDLKTDDGKWLSLEQAIAWSKARQSEILARKNARPVKRRARTEAQPHANAVAHIIERWLETPRLKGDSVSEGRKHRAPLSANTIRYYKQARRLIERLDDGRFWAMPASAFDGAALSDALDRAEQAHGLAQARALRAMVSACWKWARKAQLVHLNPAADMDETLPVLTPRIRFGEEAEIAALIAAADAMGRPEIGDSIMIGVWVGQRQGDRLTLLDGQITPRGILFRQAKKGGQPLLIPASKPLGLRLAAARARRKGRTVEWPQVIIDEKAWKPFKPDHYRHIFAEVRAKAAETMPALADFHDQDLRDTAVTWLALAGCNEIEIASITGHSLKTIAEIMKHYLGLHPDLARRAIGKLELWKAK